MINFNQLKKEKILENQEVFDLYKIFFPKEKISKDFVEICHKLTIGLNEIPDHVVLNKELKNKIKYVIYYLVCNLRNPKEYGTEIDEKKKNIVLELEILAKEYFDSFKNRLDDNIHMEDIIHAWKKEY